MKRHHRWIPICYVACLQGPPTFQRLYRKLYRPVTFECGLQGVVEVSGDVAISQDLVSHGGYWTPVQRQQLWPLRQEKHTVQGCKL